MGLSLDDKCDLKSIYLLIVNNKSLQPKALNHQNWISMLITDPN